MATKIPGSKAKHAIITPHCRRVARPAWNEDPAEAAFMEAVDRLHEEYMAICANRDDGFNAHLVLTIEGPAERAGNEG